MTNHCGRDRGFTLIEMMVVLAILAVLVSLAMVSHQHALAKAQSVEAEAVLVEVSRLETVYYANHGSYSSDLNTIGFTLNSSLKYYKVDLQVHAGGTGYQAMAVPLAGSGKQVALLLTQSKGGHTMMQKADPVALSTLVGSQPGSSGAPLMDQGVGGPGAATGGTPAKANCRQGGEATVAQDGLLDMNFCLR